MANKKNTIGSKIVIEGVNEYNANLRKIREEQAELKSEMKLCTETYKTQANSAEALKKKSEILAKQIGAENQKIESQKKMLDSAKDAREKSRKSVENYGDALKKAEQKLEDMTSSSQASADAIEEQKKEVENARTALQLAEQQYTKMDSSVTKYQTALNNSQAELEGLNRELSETDKYMTEAAESADDCAKSIDQYGKKVGEAKEETENFGKKTEAAMAAIAGAMAASGIVEKTKKVAQALMECSEQAASFETAMNKVYTIANKEAVAQSDMQQQILAQSAGLVQSSNDLADAVYNSLSAGQETENAVNFAAQATKLATGGFTDATTAVDILTTALNAYGLEATEATSISDMLITTQNLGKTTVSELAANMGRVIPLASAYNTDMAQLSTTYALLTASGVKTAESTTYIKAILNELGSSGSKVGKILTEETGKSFAELMDDGYSLGGVLEILGESVDGDTGKFNELWSSSEAGIGALSLLGNGAEKFNDVLGQMRKSTGATQQAFDKMTDSTEYAEKRMQIASENLKIAIGQQLNPAIQRLYDTGANAFEWATEFVQNNPEVVNAIVILTGVLGGAAIAVGAFTTALAAFNAMATLASGGTWLIVGAVGALVGAIAALVLQQEKEKTEMELYLDAQEEEIANRQERIDAIYAEIDAEQEKLAKMREYIQRLAELNEQEELSVQEKAEMADIVSILNTSLPKLGLAISDETGKLNVNNKALMEKTKLAIALEEANSAQEESIKILEEKNEAEKEYIELQQKHGEALEKVNKLEEEYAELEEECNKQREDTGYVINETCQAIAAVKKELESAKAEEEGLRASWQESEAQLASLGEQYNNLTECIAAVGDVTVENEMIQIEYKGIIQDVNLATAASIQELETAYQDAKTAAEDSITTQIGLFDELSNESDLTANEMAKSLQSQTDVFNQYKDDLIAAAALVEQGLLDEGLLGSIQELGMDGAGYLRELVTASQDDVEAYADVVASYEEMMEARSRLTEAIADLNTGYTVNMDNFLGLCTESYTQVTDCTEEGYENIREKIQTALEGMNTDQTEGMQALCKTVMDTVPELQTATTTLCTAAVKAAEDSLIIVDDGSSEVFRSIGKLIPDSVAAGIREGQETVATAVQDMIDYAIDSADLSGISGKIDKMLGDAFS